MPSSYTTSLRLTLPATGELTGTWGTTVNTGITELLDSAVAGTTTISTWGGAGVPYTLSNTDGAADEARKMFIVATGAPGEAKNVICPAVSKLYFFRNDTTGGFALTLKTSGGSGIAVPAGQYKVLYCNGTDVVEAFNSLASLTLGTALAASSGGTGQSTYTTGDLIYASGASALSKLGIGTNGQILTSSGTAPQWSTLSGVAVTTFSAGTTGFTPSTATSGAVTLGGTLATTNGGTGLTSFSANRIFYSSSTSAIGLSANLTFDGSTLTNTGSVKFGNGAATNTSRLMINNATNTATGIQLFQDGIESWIMGMPANSAGLAWSASGTEQMRLTTTGLGIGTSSPGAKLDVYGGASGTITNVQVGNASTAFVFGVDGGNSCQIRTAQSVPILFYTAATERMRLSSAGGLSIGTTTDPGAGGLITTGNVTLGDATTDTVTVNGYMGVGGAGAANKGLYQRNTALTGTTQYGLTAEGTFSSAATAGGVGFASSFATEAAAFTMVDAIGFRAFNVTKGAGSTITNQHGVYINDQTQGTNNYGITSAVSSGSNKWNIYASGTAQNYFAGNVGINTTDTTITGGVVGSSSRLVISGAAGRTQFSDTGNEIAFSRNAASYISANGGSSAAIITGAQSYLRFDTGATLTERMRIDSAGNLGLGVTPSAWGGTYAGALQVKSAALYSASDLRADLASNAFYNGTAFTYVNTGFATAFSQVNGQHRWYTAPSGTAGNAISFTQAMTLDASGNLGIGTTSPAAKLHVSGTGNQEVRISTFTSGNPRIQMNAEGVNGVSMTYDRATSLFQIENGGVTSVYLTTAGNLGVGTSSPTTRLQLAKANATTGLGNGGLLTLENTDGGAFDQRAEILFKNVSQVTSAISSSYTGFVAGPQYAGALIFATKGTADSAVVERMRIDSTGNLGLGVTPSAWSGVTALQIAASGAIASDNATLDINANAYYNAGYKYIRTQAASRYTQTAGAHQWYNAPSGTAGNAISFTQAMTLNASSQLLVGTTTNTNSSTVTAGGTISETVSSVQYLVASQFDVGTAPNKIPLNQYLGNLAYQNASAIAGRVGLSAGTAALPSIGSATDAATGEWFPAASTIAWSTAGTERMRLDASGNLGLGVTPSAWGSTGRRAIDITAFAAIAQVSSGAAAVSFNSYQDASNNWIYKTTNAAARYDSGFGGAAAHAWFTAPSGTAGNTISFTQAMTLDASGNLGIGVTNASAKLDIASGTGASVIGVRIRSAAGNANGFHIITDSTTDNIYLNNYYNAAMLFGTNNTERARITSTGNQTAFQPAESAQNANATLTVANLQARIITSNAAVTLTLPTGTSLEGYTTSMATDTAFECTFIATTANAITIAANGNTTVGSLTVAGNTSGTFRFRKTAANTFTVYRVA